MATHPTHAEHMQSFLRASIGAWAIFDAKYFHNPSLAPTGYYAGDKPVERYCLGRVNAENARCCLYAFATISEDRAAEIGGRPFPQRVAKQMAHSVLNSLNNLQRQAASGPAHDAYRSDHHAD